jgi:predicted nuclease with TOPRIM domain
MHNQLEQRLQALKAEFETGQKMLADLEARQAQLRETLLRISGAIQVLEELLAADAPASVQPASGAGEGDET